MTQGFYLFGGISYYDCAGGWGDFIGAFATVEEAIAAVDDPGGAHDWAHIVSVEERRVVLEIHARYPATGRVWKWTDR